MPPDTSLLQRLPHLNAEELRRLLAEHLKLPDMQGVYERLARTAPA
jgi:hypothetical protein